MRRLLTSPGLLLRLEGLALGAGAAALYAQQGGNWLLFALLFFVPDLAMAGYLAGPSFGAVCYNLVHQAVLPAILLALGLWSRQGAATSIGLIWLAHIGLDRLLGYGLKYATEFKDTHFSRV